MSTRDYKHSVRPAARGKRRRPPGTPRRWPWFTAGFVCGLLVAFVAYLREYSPETLRLVASQSALRDESQRAPAPEPPASKPRFTFYTLLPEMEVQVPERELQAAAQRERKTPAPEPTPRPEPAATPDAADDGSAAVYMMQVASFTRHEDADRLKANLALLGMVANIQTVSVNGEKTYYRVRVGPYTDASRLDDDRGRLREQNFDPMVLKVRG